MEINEIFKNKNIEQLSLNEMAQNFFYIFNNGLNRDLFLTHIKNNHSDLIQVLNKDGTVNKDIKYGSKEYRRYVDEYVKQHDNGPIKIFNPDGSLNIFDIVETKTVVNNDGKTETQNIIGLSKIYKEVHALHSNLENDLLKAVPPHLTKIHAGEPGYDIHKEDGYEIKYPTDSERIGFINCGQKTPGGVLGKIGRLALNGTSELSMSDAINMKYHDKEDVLLNGISDHARISVILESYDDLLTAVSIMQNEFGGLPKINDLTHTGKSTYESVHINTHIGNVNTEIQFHNKPDMLFKTIDDIVYHTTYNNEIDSRTSEGVEMVQIKNYLEECAKVVFAQGTFQKNVPDMDQFIEECVKKGFVRQQKPKLKNLGIYYREAYVAQRDLVNRTAKLIPAMESILEKEQTQEWGITPDEKYTSDREI